MNGTISQPINLSSDTMLFNFNEHEVRVIQDENGEPWFVATDIAKVLGYSSAKDMTRNLDDDEKGRHNLPTLGGNQELSIINESGLYSAILSSRRKEAKPFKKWVTHDVLPSIRKHGMYAKDELLDNPDVLIEVATRLKEERELRLLAEQERNQAIREKGQISSSREASVMGKLGQAVKKICRLETEVGNSQTYKQVKAINWLPDYFNLTMPAYQQIGRKLSTLSKKMELEPIKIDDSQYGTIKAYHVGVISAFKKEIEANHAILAKYRKVEVSL